LEYYYTYGLALARTNQCGEALKIAQQIQTVASEDENALFAAEETIRICEENLANPPTDVPIEEAIATEEAVMPEAANETPVPEMTATP
jgi:hypothetical protein